MPSTFTYWQTKFKTEVCSDSGHPAEAMPWSEGVEMANSVGDPKRAPSFFGRIYPNFETFDARISRIRNSRKKVHLEEQTAQKEDRFLRCRQITFMIYEYFRVTGTHESILNFSDLLSVTLRGDHVKGFDTRWDEVLLSTQDAPSDSILESFFNVRIRESDQLKTVLALYDQDVERKNMPQTFQRLKTMVEQFLIERRGLAILRPETKAPGQEQRQKSRSTGKSVSVEKKQGDCYQLKIKEKCIRRDVCSFRHRSSKRGASTRSSSPTPRSQTNNDGKILRKADRPGEAVHPGRSFRRRPRITSREVAQIHRVNPGILPCARITKTHAGCRFGESCSFLHQEPDRQQSKRTKMGGGKGSFA